LPEPIGHRLRRSVESVGQQVDAIVVCDYGLGLLDTTMLATLRSVRETCRVCAVDAHDLSRFAILRPDFVTPNLAEVSRLLGEELPADADSRLAALQRHGVRLHASTGAASVVVTMDRQGAVLLTEHLPTHRTWADPVPDNQTAGAGDTFLAATCLARTIGLPMTTAIEMGQAAADVVVHEGGTSVCGTAQLAERLGRFRDAALSMDELADRVAAHRRAGRRIVFTNGCFDLLHPGHVACLNQAKRLGDVLVVAVNSDAGVRRLKGAARPVNAAADRVAVLAALSCVDHVTVFDNDDATELINRLCPDVYVKGGDHTADSIPEAAAVRQCGGELRLLDYLPEQSSSAVISRIKAG
jgi:rfaE bifunctional protein nucleotidyltransferase chain/domain